MARDELVLALQLLRAASSLEDVQAQFADIHAALSDVTRKRSRFLEDALAAVLRHVWKFAKLPTDDDDDVSSDNGEAGSRPSECLSAVEATAMCLEFAEPLLPSADSQRERFGRDSDDTQDLTRERAVCAAFLLHLLGNGSATLLGTDGNSVTSTLRLRLTSHVVSCGVSLGAIFSTCRFREEVRESRRVLLPSLDWTSDGDFGSDDDGDGEEDGDNESKLIAQATAVSWKLSDFEYFVTETGQEYAFTSWSAEGIRVFAYVLLAELALPERQSQRLSAVISPFSWLFLIAPSIQGLLQAEESLQMRLHGIQLLSRVLHFVPDATIPCYSADASSSDASLPSFKEKCAAFEKRDWLTPVIQLATNVMVSCPEPSSRSLALASLRSLFGKVVVNDRFYLLRSLTLKCPYANVGAVFVDEIRATAVRIWASLDDVSSASPFTTEKMGELLRDVLLQASERDLVLQADLIASSSSLLRFLFIRDKTNRTGIRSDNSSSVKSVLARIQGRLRARIQEVAPHARSPDGDRHSHGSHVHYHPGEEHNRLLILEAVLESTMSG